MRFICVTEVDAKTRIPCTVEAQRTGPSVPKIKGFVYKWCNKSTFPVELAPDGRYLRAPLLYGTCDDDANLDIPGFIQEYTEAEWLQLKNEEIEARRPFASWLWNEEIQEWVAPIPRPDDAIINGGDVSYKWDEETLNWIPR